MRVQDLEPYKLEKCKRLPLLVARNVYSPPAYRVTLFGATREGFIGPVFRVEGPSADAVVPVTGSTVEFGKSDPVAGLAWAKPGLPFILVLPKGPTEAFFRGDLKLSAHLAESLAASPGVQRTRQLLCLGIPMPIPMVLSVDTFEENGLGSPTGSAQNFELYRARELYDTVKGFVDDALHDWGLRPGENAHA